MDTKATIPIKRLVKFYADFYRTKRFFFLQSSSGSRFFYIPDAQLAIQVCYQLDNSDSTLDREVKALLKLSEVLECSNLLIITRDTERILTYGDKTIEVVPIWKWLLVLE